MKARYVRSLSFEADLSFLPTDDNGRFLGEARPIAVEIDDARRAVFLALTSHIHNALRKARRSIGDVPIRDVAVYPPSNPANAREPDLRHGRLEVDVARDPRELLSLADDPAAVGQWVIAVAEQAIDRLEAWDRRFPADVVRAGIAAFRDGRHAFSFRAGERMIPGTRVKGRINVVISCFGTRRYFTALFRNEPMFQVELPGLDRPDIQIFNRFSGFEFAEGIVTIPGDEFWPLDEARRPDYMKPVEIDRRDHPETFDFMLQKGWIDAPSDAWPPPALFLGPNTPRVSRRRRASGMTAAPPPHPPQARRQRRRKPLPHPGIPRSYEA